MAPPGPAAAPRRPDRAEHPRPPRVELDARARAPDGSGRRPGGTRPLARVDLGARRPLPRDPGPRVDAPRQLRAAGVVRDLRRDLLHADRRARRPRARGGHLARWDALARPARVVHAGAACPPRLLRYLLALRGGPLAGLVRAGLPRMTAGKESGS